MAHRSPARWMAPLALLAAIAAVGYVVTSPSRDDEGTSSGGSSTGSEERGRTSTEGRTTTGRTSTRPAEPRTYRVQSGDTLGTIAEETGVPVEQLIELNPDLDPQSLNVGDRVRLRR